MSRYGRPGHANEAGPDPVATLITGTLGHFKLLKEVGMGGLGRDCLARDTVFGQMVLNQGLDRGADLAAGPYDFWSIPQEKISMCDIDETENSYVMVFEFVPGETERQVLEALLASPSYQT